MTHLVDSESARANLVRLGNMTEHDRAAEIGRRIRSRRKEAGYTGVDLARDSGCTPEWLCKIELHGWPIKLDLAIRIANTLELSLDELLNVESI